ncbi:hypothetical protein IMG5_172460 [Ichthyophthirius multifiliis]|uniref:Uncharacterized protein n=1 Tax=Ichthyophthirius multifiliis TaxID=5932 RepID=G0R1S1_ICHMU|nr:hypothetical protein IMG5_172460 [Ichthyophthirius multifiliis]EGR28573.1 hypothetical protein IMG5_172460 [Ichthyophthirius multifiliis]|eukprot:XP_004029809.1 hypothetical protein IMG5_172460 [Ichthyophthirius multifiliis]
MKNIPKKDKQAKLIYPGIQNEKLKSGSLPSFSTNKVRFNEDLGFYLPKRTSYVTKKPYPDQNVFPIQQQQSSNSIIKNSTIGDYSTISNIVNAVSQGQDTKKYGFINNNDLKQSVLIQQNDSEININNITNKSQSLQKYLTKSYLIQRKKQELLNGFDKFPPEINSKINHFNKLTSIIDSEIEDWLHLYPDFVNIGEKVQDKFSIARSKEVEVPNDGSFPNDLNFLRTFQGEFSKDKSYIRVALQQAQEFKQKDGNVDLVKEKYLEAISQMAEKNENEQSKENNEPPLSSFQLYKPNFYILVEQVGKNYELDMQNLKNRKISQNFLGIMRSILDSKYNEFILYEITQNKQANSQILFMDG